MNLLQSSVPLYYQLKTYVKEKIDNGEWPAGSAIPSERELERLLGLSRTPIRQALGELVTEGLLERKHGKGTFVAERVISQTTTKLVGLVEHLHQQQLEPVIVVRDYTIHEAPEDITEALCIPSGTSMIHVTRQILVNGSCVITDDNFFNISLGPFLTREKLEESTVFNLLESNGVNVAKGSQSFTAAVMNDTIAERLNSEPGSPVLTIRTLLFNDRGQPLQCNLSYCHPDHYTHQILLIR